MKNYKYGKLKIFVIFAILTFLCTIMFMLFSCADEKPIAINLTDLAKAIGEEIDLSNTDEYSSEQIKNNYGVTAEDTLQMVVLKELDVNSAEVIILFEAHTEEKAKEIENKLKEYKTYKLNELRDYTLNPDNERQYYIVEDSEMMVEQKYVFWAAHRQNKEINGIIKDYIEKNRIK